MRRKWIIIATIGFFTYAIYWFANTVPCPSCIARFNPESNKAPMLGAAVAGATAGAAAGAAGGAYAGAGTGIAIGGVGAVPGAGVGAVIGGAGGAIIGGMSGAWHRDSQVKCPFCDEIFENPKN